VGVGSESDGMNPNIAGWKFARCFQVSCNEEEKKVKQLMMKKL
jgi:hypothetical protein